MKPLIVNSQEGATWTVVVFLDSNESLVINKIVIKPISIGGKLQRYVISLLEVTSGYS